MKIEGQYRTLGEYTGPTNAQLSAAMVTRDLMSATLSLAEMSPALLKAEIDDIELAHARLSKVIQRICNGQTA
jgi:hypothetical protein